MLIGVPRETFSNERRVALTPPAAATLVGAGHEIVLESGAGEEAGLPDEAYRDKGATVGSQADARGADVVLKVRVAGAEGPAPASFRAGQAVLGFANPLGAPEAARDFASTGAMLFAVELMPRITRAQAMDGLSSQATIAGYKAVLLAARELPKMFPMLTTAAGTIAPARVFVIGAGVAGLQAIATARRLGAVVEAYDVRPAVKEQVESLGGKFVELELEVEGAETKGGYAREMDEEVLRKQREMMTRVVSGSDAVITTALVPGKQAPVLVTADMVRGMQPGSVVVDIAAEQGGNCELSKPDETVLDGGVTIFGPTNLPATVPFHASQLYAKNLTNFLTHLAQEGELALDMEDEITRETLVTRDGEVVHPRVREALGLEVAAAAGGAS